MKAHIINANKRYGDKIVTGTYLNIIKSALIKLGYEFSDNNLNKEDLLVFDESKIAIKYYFKGYKNYIIWIQGVVPEEALMKGYSKARYYAHSIIEKIVLSNAKFIFFVSDEMKKHYETKYNLSLDCSFIMPCFNETSLNENAFSEDKLSENTFTYVGSLHPWQCFEETVQVYNLISSYLTSSTFSVYTSETKKAFDILNRNDTKNFSVEFLPADQLSNHLSKIKFGFVLRQDNIVNRVATPTKISNYISNGVIPIYSECLSSFDDFNKRSKGFAISTNLELLNSDKLIEDISRNIDINEFYKWSDYVFQDYYNADKYINNMIIQLNHLHK